MKTFAIKHLPTGQFMPARLFKNGTGWTYWNPTDGAQKPYDPTPRLFPTLRGAQNALSAWLQGEWQRVTGTDGDWETGYFDVDLGPAPNNPEIPRQRADMGIIECELVLP